MRKIIENAKANQQVVSIFTNKDEPERCSVGFIKALSEKEVMLLSLDKNAEPEGLFVFNISSIYRIDLNSQYESRFMSMYHNSKATIPAFEENDKNLYFGICEYSRKHCFDLWVNFYGNSQTGVSGSILDVYEDYLVVNRALEDGSPDGISWILIESIDFIACEFENHDIILNET